MLYRIAGIFQNFRGREAKDEIFTHENSTAKYWGVV